MDEEYDVILLGTGLKVYTKQNVLFLILLTNNQLFRNVY